MGMGNMGRLEDRMDLDSLLGAGVRVSIRGQALGLGSSSANAANLDGGPLSLVTAVGEKG